MHTSESHPDRIAPPSWLLVAIVALCCVAWAVCSLWSPLGYDNGLHAWHGHIVLTGGMLYRDAFEVRGPIVAFVNAAAQAVFGVNSWGIRIFDWLFLLLGAWGVRGLTTSVYGDTPARAAVVLSVSLFALWIAALAAMYLAQPDYWSTSFLALGLAPLFRSRSRLLAICFLSGMAVSVGLLSKPLHGGYVLLAAAALWHSSDASSEPRRQTRIMALGAGILVPVAAAVAFVSVRGALHDYIYQHLIFSLTVYSRLQGGVSVATRLIATVQYLTTEPPFVTALPFAAVGALKCVQRDKRIGSLLLAWCALAIATVFVQGRFWVHHWHPLLPPFAVLTALGVVELGRALSDIDLGAIAGLRRSLKVDMARVLAVFVFLPSMTRIAVVTLAWLAMMRGQGTLNTNAFNAIEGVGDFPEFREAAAYVRQHTSPKDRVLVWDMAATINFLSGREPPSRHTNTVYLLWHTTSAWRTQMKAEFISDMNAHTPALVLVPRRTARSDSTFLAGTFGDFHELPDFLRDHYTVDTVLNRYVIMRRIAAVSGNQQAPPE